MKILIDMNLSPDWVDFFNLNEIKAVHWSKIGDIRAEDRIIFDFASENNYIVFTHDLDFGAILAATNAKTPSVFQVRTQDVTIENIGIKVILCLTQFKDHLEQGCIISLNETTSKVRILPFR